MATFVLDMMAQYNQELDLLMQVYQQRFVVECATLPSDLASLCARIQTNEWVRSSARTNTVRAISKLDPVTDQQLFDIVLEKITSENNVLNDMQNDIATTLGFPNIDAPIRDLKTCIVFIKNASPASASTCEYIDGFLDLLVSWQSDFDAILSRDMALFHAHASDHANCPFEPQDTNFDGIVDRCSTSLVHPIPCNIPYGFAL